MILDFFFRPLFFSLLLSQSQQSLLTFLKTSVVVEHGEPVGDEQGGLCGRCFRLLFVGKKESRSQSQRSRSSFFFRERERERKASIDCIPMHRSFSVFLYIC